MYELSKAAAKDLEKILERSVTDFGISQTEIYFASLKNCLELLSESPEMGTTADDIRAGYRRFVHQSHTIFYRSSGQGLLIIRVLHKRMDIYKYMKD